MKLAKKALSVFLSLLMVFGTCSVCLTGFSFTAAAASSYTVAQVKALVDAAASKAVTQSSSGNGWNYPSDDGSVLAAAEAIYDYAVNGVRVAGTTSTLNSSGTIYDKVIANLGYATNSNQGIFIKNVLYPNGTAVYSYSGLTKTGNWEDKSSMSNGTNLTSNGNVSYNTTVSDSVTKTAIVNVDTNSYLLTFDSIADIPSSFNTKITYSFVHTNGKSASQTNQTQRTVEEGSGCDKEDVTYYTHYWTSYKWNYLSSVTRTVNATNTTAKTLLQTGANYFTSERLATTAADLLDKTAAELTDIYNEAVSNYEALANNFSSAVIDKFFGVEKIEAYMQEVQFATQVVNAMPNMKTMLGYINDGYDANNWDEMSAIYTNATNTYNAIKDYRTDVFEYIVANVSELSTFTLEASKAFLDSLYYDMELYQLRELKATIDADIAANEALVAYPENKTDITDIELAAIIDRLNGYQSAWAQYSAEANNEVFTEGKYYISDFRSAVQLKIDTRAAQVEYTAYYEYFLPLIFAPVAEWTDEEIMNRYTADSAKNDDLVAEYAKQEGIVGAEITESVYTFVYEEEELLLTTAVASYLESLKVNTVTRVEYDLNKIKEYSGDSTDVNFNNFVGLKTEIDAFNEDLYKFANEKNPSWISKDYQELYGSISTLLENYNSFVKSGGLDKFEQHHYHDKNGVFVTRFAGDQGTDAEGNPIGYANDIAREGEDENYDVTEEKVNETIVKLDDFITSKDLGHLVGLENQAGEITDLPAYIDEMLTNSLFTNETVNVLVAMLFPMLADTLSATIDDLIANMGPAGYGSTGSYNLNDATDLIEGTAYIFLDTDKFEGKQYQKDYPQVFKELGLYVFPSTLAESLAAYDSSKYGTSSDIYKSLTAAGRDWSQFNVIPEGETEGTITLDFDWGVTGYDSFVSTVSAVFNAMLPVLRTLLCGADFSKFIESAGYVYSPELDGNVWYLFFVNNQELAAYADLTLTIDKLNVYKDVLIPVFEALGISDGIDTDGDGKYELGYTFKSLSTTASATQITTAIFEPILALIKQLKAAPISKVLEILPGVVYALSMDKIQEMINGININLGIIVDVNVDNSNSDLLVDIIGWIGSSWLEGIVDQNVALSLAELVDLNEMLGFNLANINDILKYVLESLGMEGLSLPTINAGEIITCSSYSYVSSIRTSGQRLKFTADKADVFYFLLKYLISAIGNREFLEGIIEFIQTSDSEEGDADADGDGVPDAPAEEIEAVELPEIVYSIINNVNANPMSALAALVELFVPQTYGKEDIDWVASQYDYDGIDGMNDASIVYLKYGNDWQKSDADYLINNVDALVESILAMTGSEETSINALIQGAFNDLLTNDSITAIISGLSDLGTLLGDEFIYDLLDRELEMDLTAMNDQFAYLFVTDEDRAAEGFVEPLKPGDEGYTATYAITASQDAEGNIIWSYNGTEFVDGDAETFVDLLCESIKEFAPLLAAFLKGENIGLFNDAIEFLGYENYADSVGIFFELLGIADVMTQAEYEAYCDANANGDVAALNYTVKQLFNWVNDYLLDGNTVQKIVELLPNLVYFIESNGLSTVIHNLLMPVLVILDTVRPIIDLDVNAVLSLIVSDLINYGEIDTDMLLQFISGVYVNDDLDYKWFAIDVNNLTLSTIIPLVDTYFGTNFAASQLVNPGLKSLCSGVVEYDSVIEGKAYKSTMDASDALTILLSAVLEAAEFEVADGKTNGDIICEFIDAQTVADGGEPVAAEVYSAVVALMGGVDVESKYTVPDWDYMFTADIQPDDKVSLPKHSIVYLGYNTDWTPEVAESVYGILDEVVDLVLESTLEEGETIATLINGLLEDNVYSDAILNELVELIVNAIAMLDGTLRDLVDVIVDTDIASWFEMCEPTVDEEGNTVYVCTYDWGVDEAAEEDKKDIFVARIKEVLEPANSLLSWLFFGTSYEFFTGTEKNEDGTYKYNDIISINGGRGYEEGLVPILEALGCENLKPASDYYIDENTYNVPQAVEDIFNSLLKVVDDISGKPVAEVFELLPNLIYFINADGVMSSVNNLLAPVDGIIEMLAPVISEDGSAVTLGGLLEETLEFDISNLTMDTLLGIAADKGGFILSDEMYQILRTFYIGELTQFTSVNGDYAYRMTYTDAESEYDMLTIVLCFALDAFKLNDELFSDLLGEDVYDSVVTLIAGAVADFTYTDPDWAYMYEGDDALEQLIANNLPERTEETKVMYTQYTNNWNKATADYLDSVLFDLVKGITESARDDGKDLGILLDDAITDGLYQDDILNSIIEAVVGLMLDYEEIIKGAGALLGAESIAKWFEYCEVTVDENGETVVTCTHNWGIDAATTNEAKREAFVEGFVDALEPAYRLLAWLLFGEDYEFLDGTTSEVLITIKGGNGYAEGLVPLLEALGCTMGADTDSGIKAPEAFYVDGELDMELAVRDVFTSLTDWLNEICGDMNEGSIDVMLEKLPNVVYFINAGGLKSVVNNLLQPVNFILEALEPMGVSVDFSTLVKQIDITNIDFYAIFDLVEDLVDLYFPDEIQKFVAEFYMGEVVEFTSANGKQAFRMQYTEAESRADMITILISLVLEAAQDPRNEGQLIDWLGEDIYWSILSVLKLEKCKDMEDYDWILTEYANTGKQFSAIETSTRYSVYNEYWTKDKAQYMADNFNPMVSNVLCMLGLEINGTVTHDIYDLLDVVISDNLYTQEMADTILNAIKDLLSMLTELEPYGEYIIDVLNTAFGIDLSVYDTMTVTIEEGTREEFEAALAQMLVPVVPLLEVILCGENLSLFYELDGSETIVIFGSEGYAYGIIPLFEALGCEMPTPEEYKAAVAADPEAAIKYLTTPLLDRVDVILADPIGGLLEILPSAMYFINSNGLETAFTNLVAAVDTVLVGLEPVVGARSLEELLDIDLSEYNAEYLVELLADVLTDATGMDFSSVAVDLVAELTFGEVVDYVSANGETYYTMNSDGVDDADMVTAVLRMAIDFITTEDNLEKIKVLLAESITDEDALNSVYSILDTLAEYAAEDPGMSKALSFLYAVFEAAAEALENTDDVYHDVNNSWQLILKMFETSNEPIVNQFGDKLKGFLNENFDGIFDDEGIASDGAITFFDKIKAFFERIAEFFRKLFGME